MRGTTVTLPGGASWAQNILWFLRVVMMSGFLQAVELVKRVGEVAEAEGHPLDLYITGWNNMHTSTHIDVASADGVRGFAGA
jgi:hypothetical protein